MTKIPFVDLHSQYLSLKPALDEAIAEVIAESAFIRGRHVENFEEAWARTLDVKHCISCANGTDALYITMRGLGIKPGDEVITTAHSWIATSETITQAGGRVAFCDTDPKTFTINPELIESKITSRTVGIIPVHLYGQAADMDPIMAIAKKHNLWVVEDCAQAHLARYRGQLVGTFGNAATFSFYPGKNLGAYGDAGCILTNEEELATKCRMYSHHGAIKKHEHQMEGINSRLDGMQAALLSAKLKHLPQWTAARQRVARLYDAALAGIPQLRTPQIRDGSTHVYHLYVIACERRDELKAWLGEQGIESAVHYPTALPLLELQLVPRSPHIPGRLAHRAGNWDCPACRPHAD